MKQKELAAQQDFVIVILTSNKGLVHQLSRTASGGNLRMVGIERFDEVNSQRIVGIVAGYIIASDAEDPIRTAQRLHAFEKNAQIIILAESSKTAELHKQAIRITPLLGRNVSCVEESDTEMINLFLRKSQKAAKYREIIKESNSQISVPDTSLEQAYNQQFINKLMDIAPVGIAVVNRPGNILGWNREAGKIFGENEVEVLGTPISRYFDGAERSKLEQFIASSFTNKTDGSLIENLELRRTTSGETTQIVSCTSALFSSSGIFEEVIVLTINDITRRKVAEAKLKRVNKTLAKQAKELAVSNAELEQFAFVASHDLQEPLRMVTGFLSRLEDKYEEVLDEKGKKYIHFARDGARRMQQIILDLLEFSRLGRAKVIMEDVNMNDILEEVLTLNKKLIKDTDTKIESDPLPVIRVAKGQMYQLLQNLLNNAIKYQESASKPIVRIGFQEDEKYWRFSVVDNGIGIDEQYTDKIFNIFQRLHANNEYSGSGMGLAICKKIVDFHGGNIWVESEEGKGSTFHFTIRKSESKIIGE